jgi:hypothetical protein
VFTLRTIVQRLGSPANSGHELQPILAELTERIKVVVSQSLIIVHQPDPIIKVQSKLIDKEKLVILLVYILKHN